MLLRDIMEDIVFKIQGYYEWHADLPIQRCSEVFLTWCNTDTTRKVVAV